MPLYRLTFLSLVLCCFFPNDRQFVVQKACGFNKIFSTALTANFTDIASPINDSLINELIRQLDKDSLHLVVAATSDANVQYAITGLIEKALPAGQADTFYCIVVNEENLNKRSGFEKITILSHEIGHINNGNFVSSRPIDSSYELGADYYAGKSCARLGFANVQQACDAYENLDSDDVHPSSTRRQLEVRKGWAAAKVPSKLLKFLNSNSPLFSPIVAYNTVFADQIKLVQVTTPGRNGRFNTRIFLAPKNDLIPASEIIRRVDHVEYYIHESSYPHPAPGPNYSRKDNFSIYLNGWGDDFDVFADITFVDKTVKRNIFLTVKFL